MKTLKETLNEGILNPDEIEQKLEKNIYVDQFMKLAKEFDSKTMSSHNLSSNPKHHDLLNRPLQVGDCVVGVDVEFLTFGKVCALLDHGDISVIQDEKNAKNSFGEYFNCGPANQYLKVDPKIGIQFLKSCLKIK